MSFIIYLLHENFKPDRFQVIFLNIEMQIICAIVHRVCYSVTTLQYSCDNYEFTKLEKNNESN